MQAIPVVFDTGNKIYVFYNTEKEQVRVCECVACVPIHAHTCMNTRILLIIASKRYRKEKHKITKNKGWKGSKDALHLVASSKTSLIKALFFNYDYLSITVASIAGENQGPICMSPMQILKAVWKRATVCYA